MRFGAKGSAFWCKTQGEMVLNAVQNAAKRKEKSINILCICINKTFKNHEIHGKKRVKWSLKSGVLGSKSGFWGCKNHGLATKLERQNGAKCR